MSPSAIFYEILKESLSFGSHYEKLLELYQKTDLILFNRTGQVQCLLALLPLLEDAPLRESVLRGDAKSFQEQFEQKLVELVFELRIVDKQKFITRSLEEIKALFGGVEGRLKEQKTALHLLLEKQGDHA